MLYCRGTPTALASTTHTKAAARLGHALSDRIRAGILLALRNAPPARWASLTRSASPVR